MLLPVARGAMDSDTLLYFIVGRGVLNGLAPYADLFESKPPGMFLLAAISLWSTHGEWLAVALECTILVLIPLLIVAFAWRVTKSEEGVDRFVIMSLSAGIGLLLSLYLLERAGTVEAESFGV